MIELNQLPRYPYPSDAPTRFGFIVGDIIAWAIIAGMILIPIKSVLRF
jgi:hypothetical protein